MHDVHRDAQRCIADFASSLYMFHMFLRFVDLAEEQLASTCNVLQRLAT